MYAISVPALCSDAGAPAALMVEVFPTGTRAEDPSKFQAYTLVVPFNTNAAATCIASTGTGPCWSGAPMRLDDHAAEFTVVLGSGKGAKSMRVRAPMAWDTHTPLAADVYVFETHPLMEAQYVTRCVASGTLPGSCEGFATDLCDFGSVDDPGESDCEPAVLGSFKCTGLPFWLQAHVRAGLALRPLGDPVVGMTKTMRAYFDTWSAAQLQLAESSTPVWPSALAYILSPIIMPGRTMARVPGETVALVYGNPGAKSVLSFDEAWLVRQFSMVAETRGLEDASAFMSSATPLTIDDVIHACSAWCAARPYTPDFAYDPSGARRAADKRSCPLTQSANDCEDDAELIVRLFVYLSEHAGFVHPVLQKAQRLARQYVAFMCLGGAKNAYAVDLKETEPHMFGMVVRRDVAVRWISKFNWRANSKEVFEPVDPALPVLRMLEGTTLITQTGERSIVQGRDAQYTLALAQLSPAQARKLPTYTTVPLRFTNLSDETKISPSDLLGVIYYVMIRCMTNWYQVHGTWGDPPPPTSSAGGDWARLAFFFSTDGTMGAFASTVVRRAQDMQFEPRFTTWIDVGHAQSLGAFERPVFVKLDMEVLTRRARFYKYLCARNHWNTDFTVVQRAAVRANNPNDVLVLYMRERMFCDTEAGDTAYLVHPTRCDEVARDLNKLLRLMNVKEVVVRMHVAYVLAFYCFF